VGQVEQQALPPIGQAPHEAVAGPDAEIPAAASDHEAVEDVPGSVVNENIAELVQRNVLVDDERRRIHHRGDRTVQQQVAAKWA
jgi:hypothetical protein